MFKKCQMQQTYFRVKIYQIITISTNGLILEVFCQWKELIQLA